VYKRQDIDGVLTSKARLPLTELSVKQFMWIEELSAARGLLSTVINSTELQTTYGGFNLNPLVIYNATVASDTIMAKLQQFIRDKSIDPKTKTPKTQPSDVVYDTAQKYLGSLMANMYIIIQPGVTKNTISGLQAMRVSIRQQMTLDRQESSICSNFLTSVENNPVFQVAKPYIDKLLEDLAKTPIGSGIANQILTGDISGVIGILEGYHLANDVVNLINCENSKTGQNIDPSVLGLDANITQEATKSMERALSYLRDKKMQFDSFPLVMENLDLSVLGVGE